MRYNPDTSRVIPFDLKPSRRDAPRRIVMVAFQDAQVLDITGPLEVFASAARLLENEQSARRPAYTVEIVTSRRGPFTVSSGIKLIPARTIQEVRGKVDTLLIAGGRGARDAIRDRKLLGWIRRMTPRVRRLCSVCTGAFVLAEAGVLDGRAATTHWESCEWLARRYPKISVKTDPIFVRDGKIFTSAGVSAGIDLALALVEQDHGRRIALAVARELVMFIRRPGGQSQFSAQLRVQTADHEPIAEVQSFIADHLSSDLSVAALARRAAMSPRNFARVFGRETGMTPAEFVEAVRVEAARRRLEESADGIDAITQQCGFGTRESMRRAFIRKIHVAPGGYRSRFKRADSTDQGMRRIAKR